jgi:hypothetical protein
MPPRTTIVVDSPLAAERLRTEHARAGRAGARVLGLARLAARLAGGFVAPADLVEVQTAVRTAPADRLGDLRAIADLPGFARAAARTLSDAWHAGIDLAALAAEGRPPRWRELAALDAHVRAALPRTAMATPDLVAHARERLAHADAVLGEVTLHRVDVVPPAYRGLLNALAERVPIAWLAVRAERPAWLSEAIAYRGPTVEAPTVALEACADPAHEVVEALRWVRLRLGEGHGPVDLAIVAASVETHDAAMHARIAESGLPVHAAHGVPALTTRDGQAAAALADAVVRGVSRNRIERLVALARSPGGPLVDLPSDWARALPPEAALTEPGRWRQALGRAADAASAETVLRLVDDVAAGPDAAAATGDAWLRGRARQLWRRALVDGPATAVDATLERLRVDDGVDPHTAVVWAPASMLVAAPRRRMRLLGLASRAWPRRRSEDPLLPDRLLGDVALHERSGPRRDRDHFDALISAAADEIVLSRPRRGGDGRRQAPSPLVRPWSRAEQFRRPRDPGAHPLSAADRRAARPSELARDPFIGAARGAWRDWQRPELTPHDGRVRAGHPALVRAVDRVHSATSLQLLLRDPFGFMAHYALHWKEPVRDETPIDLDPLAFGSLLHRVLERALVDLERRGGLAAASAADVEAAVSSATAEVAEAWTAELPVPPPVLWAAQLRNVGELARAALAYPFPAFEAQRSYVEVPFGRPVREDDAEPGEGPWAPGTPVTVSGTAVEVRGVIDRLDLGGAGSRARVIDYKSGKARFGGDLAEGAELQRALYANAVRQLLGPDVVIDAVLLHPRAGTAIPLDDPDAALAQLARAIEIAMGRVRDGWAVPGRDAFDRYAPFPLALPADDESYRVRKADALADALAPVARALATAEGADA